MASQRCHARFQTRQFTRHTAGETRFWHTFRAEEQIKWHSRPEPYVLQFSRLRFFPRLKACRPDATKSATRHMPACASIPVSRPEIADAHACTRPPSHCRTSPEALARSQTRRSADHAIRKENAASQRDEFHPHFEDLQPPGTAVPRTCYPGETPLFQVIYVESRGLQWQQTL